jgi:hypothetical protein
LSYTRSPAGTCHLGIEAVNRSGSRTGIDRMGSHALGRDSHDEPDRHRCNFDRSPLVVRLDLCGAMARLID